MTDFLLSPPIAFAALLLLFLGLAHAMRHQAAASSAGKHKTEAYAGGVRGVDQRQAPDYSKFYAFTVATAPAGALTLPLLYVAAGGLALLIVFRR